MFDFFVEMLRKIRNARSDRFAKRAQHLYNAAMTSSQNTAFILPHCRRAPDGTARRNAAQFAHLLLAALLCAGCREELVKGKSEDRSYVELPKTVQTEDARLAPLAVGSRWVYDVEERSRATGRVTARGVEIATIVGKRRVGSYDGFVLERRRNNGATVVSQEIYAHRKESGKNRAEYSQLAFGTNGENALDPPYPIFRFPVRKGDTNVYRGAILRGTSSARTGGAVRTAVVERLSLPAGKFDAWRTDSVLRVSGKGRATAVRSFSWFAPNVGVVQQRYMDDGSNVLITKVLRSFVLK